jgi:hypothetical protein
VAAGIGHCLSAFGGADEAGNGATELIPEASCPGIKRFCYSHFSEVFGDWFLVVGYGDCNNRGSGPDQFPASGTGRSNCKIRLDHDTGKVVEIELWSAEITTDSDHMVP